MCTLKLLYSGDERGLWNKDGWMGRIALLLAFLGVCVMGRAKRGGGRREYHHFFHTIKIRLLT